MDVFTAACGIAAQFSLRSYRHHTAKYAHPLSKSPNINHICLKHVVVVKTQHRARDSHVIRGSGVIQRLDR